MRPKIGNPKDGSCCLLIQGNHVTFGCLDGYEEVCRNQLMGGFLCIVFHATVAHQIKPNMHANSSSEIKIQIP